MQYPKKLGVFISSTFKDLKAVRDDAILSILDAGHIPMGMEFFRAGEIKIGAIEDGIKNCDVYMLILGSRYGSPVDSQAKDSISFVELEYQLAKNLHKKIIAIELDERYLFDLAKESGYENAHSVFFEMDKKRSRKYDEFKAKIRDDLVVGQMKDKAKLSNTIANTLNKLNTESYLSGWTHSHQGIMTWDMYISLIQRLANMLQGPESANGYFYNTLVGVNSGGLITAGLLSKKRSQNFPLLALYSNLGTNIADFDSLSAPFNNKHVLSALKSKSATNILLVDSILRPESSIEHAYRYIRGACPETQIKTAVLIADRDRADAVDYCVEIQDTQGVQFPYHGMNYTFI